MEKLKTTITNGLTGGNGKIKNFPKIGVTTDLVLVTSNPQKISEFRRIFPDINLQNGEDLPEVLSDIETVCIYKSKDAGVNKVVEDSTLIVNGIEVPDIKFRLKEEDWRKKHDGSELEFVVLIGHNDGNNITLYKGSVKGKLVLGREDNEAFGFDDVFVPDGESKTLYELSKEGKKDDFSPRRIALINFIGQISHKIVLISDIPEWTGEFQK